MRRRPAIFDVWTWRLASGQLERVWSGMAAGAGDAVRQARQANPNLSKKTELYARPARSDPAA
jgi:hypothetical protein